MTKTFNITGTCYAEYHYMADTSQKIAAILKMVERGEYFTINRPRQYGKTTALGLIEAALKKNADYLAIKISFEGIGTTAFQTETNIALMFWEQLEEQLEYIAPDVLDDFLKLKKSLSSIGSLSRAITKFVQKTNKKIVILIDEVDASSNFQVFLKFLAMLRNKYLNRYAPSDATFHSIILAGVNDIKTLKLKMQPNRGGSEYNSPWNIAADFKVAMHFSPSEIEPMLAEYAEAEKVDMDIPLIAQKLYYFTSGYPFLVSKLCKMIAEELLPTKMVRVWTVKDIEQAVGFLIKQNNTNFESLIKNLERHQDLYNLVFALLVTGNHISFNIHNPTIQLGILYGVFQDDSRRHDVNGIRIHNRIYERLIYNYLVSKTETKLSDTDFGFLKDTIRPNRTLDIEVILLKFQAFMKNQHSERDTKFLERHGRLIFLAFLKPILNGKGHFFKEVEITEEKRLDLAITFYQHKYIVELKNWYGEKAHQSGITQLADYLTDEGQEMGYLLIFEHRHQKTWRTAWIDANGKRIFAVWV